MIEILIIFIDHVPCAEHRKGDRKKCTIKLPKT